MLELIFLIQIDDAGSGSLIGGTIIGMYRIETGEYFDEVIPLKYYSKANMKKKAYLRYVVKIVQRGFKKLNVRKDEPVEICRGYMFDELRKWLDEKNYIWKNTVITGPLQEKVEKSFEEYVISLGFPEAFIKYTKYPFHFHRILKWVYADYDHRKLLCKVGWKSWEKYGNLPLEIEYGYLPSKREYYCLKCGKKLKHSEKVKIIKYESNRPNQIFLHKHC